MNGAFALLETPLHVTRKVGEFIFDGYPDPLLKLAELLPEGFLPVIIPFDKFGWFYTRNGSATYDGVFNMFTGKSNISRFGMVARWNYENPIPSYESDCGVLNGSAGEFFLPHPKKGGSISLFSSDICRMLTLNYKEEVKVEGVKGYRYWGDAHTFDNVSAKPETWCYCPSGECAPHGAIDVSPCKYVLLYNLEVVPNLKNMKNAMVITFKPQYVQMGSPCLHYISPFFQRGSFIS